MLDQVTTDFVDEASMLPPAELEAAFDRLVDLRPEGGKERVGLRFHRRARIRRWIIGFAPRCCRVPTNSTRI